MKVRAGAKTTGFCGKLGDAWKLQIAAPPVDGKANKVVIEFVARLAGVPKSNVLLIVGHTNPSKLIEVIGLSQTDLDRAILESHGSP